MTQCQVHLRRSDISAQYRRTLARLLEIGEDAIPSKPWDTSIYDFASFHAKLEYKVGDTKDKKLLKRNILRSIAGELAASSTKKAVLIELRSLPL